MLFKKALVLAVNAHENQVDKAGEPYILHLMHVATQVQSSLSWEEEEEVRVLFGDFDVVVAAALLHDILEDTEVGYTEVAEATSIEVAELVKILTRKPTETYSKYINRICLSGSPSACLIKVCDLSDNLGSYRRRAELPPLMVESYMGAAKNIIDALDKMIKKEGL